MYYIPKEWIISNEDKVFEILNKVNTDVIDKDIDIISELEAIGETIIIEKIEDGTIMFGA